ncbi:MAG: hypothetical protein H0X28_02500 [Solirubrobacterales bacterium]|nr:hypothetical protein [Solirubrobacterales bacterium]
MSRRIHIVIPDQVARELTDLADAAGESPSTLAATLVRNEIANQGSQTQIRKPACGSRRTRLRAPRLA